MRNRLITITKTNGLLGLLTFALAACSGSDDDSQPASNEITYDSLPRTIEVNEGERVTLDLNLQGEGAGSLSFTWRISHHFLDIEFSGQGTDSISFIAPDVTGLTGLSIFVNLNNSTSDTVVLGNISQFTSVQINDLDVPDVQLPFDSDRLDQVSNLNFVGLAENSTWLRQSTSLNKETANNIEQTIVVDRYSYLYLDSVDGGEQTLTATECGSEVEQVIDVTNYASELVCESSNSELVIFQSEDEFSLNFLCDERLIQSDSFVKKSDERVQTFGELSIEFETEEALENTTEVCGTARYEETTSYDFTTQRSDKLENSQISVFSTYVGNPIELRFNFADYPIAGFSYLGFFSPTNIATLHSLSLPALSNVPQSGADSGALNFDFDNELTDMSVDFDFDITPSGGPIEEADGAFKLIFE